MSCLQPSCTPPEQSAQCCCDLVDSVPLGICVVDGEMTVVAWNRQLADWTGRSCQQVVGQRLTDLYPSLLDGQYVDRIRESLQSGVPAVFSATLHQRFLPVKSHEFPAEPWMIQETRVRRLSETPPRLVITIQDLTGAVRQQRSLRRDRAELLRTRHALESANASLKCSLAAAEENTRQLQEEVRDRLKVEADLQKQTQVLIAAKKREAEHTRWLEELVRELTAARQAAESAAKAKSEFLANMSHEIRTPMTAILGYVDLLRDAGLPDAEREQATEAIHRNGAHLMDIINDILDISKIEAGKMSIESTPVDPREVVHDVAEMMKLRAEERSLSLAVQMTNPLPERILSDPTRLRQILVNLVGNAIKFTKTGGVKIGIHWLNPRTPRGRLRIQVEDTGIGMSPETLNKLFQPFVQADSRTTRQFDGTGLGLAISQNLAKLLRGEITVASELGRGSTFTVDLECPGTVEEIAEPKNSPGVAKALPLDGLHLLVVDDAADNRKLLSFHLKKAGATVQLAENGQEALDAIAATRAAQPFDVVLMDMQMPVLDGYEATRQMRASGDRTPVIAVTAHAMAEDRQKCLAAGCSDYLTKPIQRDKLVAAIVQWVQASLALSGQ